jgi:uncharacterized protein
MPIKFWIPALVVMIGIWSLTKSHLAHPQVPAPATMTEPNISTAQILQIEAKAMIGEYLFELEIAKTARQQEIGLMFRQHLAENRGMLFPVNPPQSIDLWMKQTRIPLDVLYICNGKIVKIDQNLPPCLTDRCEVYSSGGVVDRVIEIVGGTAEKLQLKVGNTVSINDLRRYDSFIGHGRKSITC